MVYCKDQSLILNLPGRLMLEFMLGVLKKGLRNMVIRGGPAAVSGNESRIMSLCCSKTGNHGVAPACGTQQKGARGTVHFFQQ